MASVRIRLHWVSLLIHMGFMGGGGGGGYRQGISIPANPEQDSSDKARHEFSP